MFTPTRSTRVDSVLTFILFLLISLAVPSWTLAQEKDSEAPVGAVGGAVHADLFTGTATTSIPIEVPPGRQGVQPDLSLVYASGNGNGWVGMGWKLEKSVIERRTKDGLDYSADDYVVRLSGINAELVAIDQPTPPLNHTDFRAKIEGSFTRIHKKTAADGKPYFEATDKLGKKYLFGQTAASRLFDPADDTRIFRWCLDYVIDVHGNYMEITYSLDENQGYLAQIDYTGNVGAGLLPTNSVVFHLEDLDVVNPTGTVNPMYNRVYLDPDPNDPNVDSPPYKTAKRLKTVEVRANNVLQRAYKLEYVSSPSSGRSLLVSVQQFGSDAQITGGTVTPEVGTYLPPIATDWQTDADGTFTFSQSLPGASTGSNSFLNTAYKNIYTGDWDGDGRTDMLHLAPTPQSAYSWVALSNGDGTFNFMQSLPGANTTTNSYINITHRNIYTGDWDGDGRTDLLHLHPSADPKYSWVALSEGDGSFNFMQSLPGAKASTNSYLHVDNKTILTGDWDGDGLTDLLHLHPDNNTTHSWVAFSNGDGTFNFMQTLPGASTGSNSFLNTAYKNIYTGDWNGDGRTDMLHLAPTPQSAYSWVALSNGDGTFNFMQSLPGANTTTNSYINITHRNIYTGDWNGDGLTDLLHLHPDNIVSHSWVALSNGDGTFNFMQSLPGASTTTSSYLQCFHKNIKVGDWNGDGLTDLLHLHPDNIVSHSWVALSKGDGTFAFNQALPGASTTTSSYLKKGNQRYSGIAYCPFEYINFDKDIHVGDWDGDGLTDLLHLHPDSNVTHSWVALAKGSKSDLLTSLDNGLGGSSTIDYAPSSQFNNTLLPYVTQVVEAITVDDGNGNVSPTIYQYEGGYHHLAEREFRGFNTTSSIGPAGPNGEQTIITTAFHQGNDTDPINNPNVPDGYLKGAPYYTQVADLAGNVFTRAITWYKADVDGAPFYTPPAMVITEVCDGDATCVQTQTEYKYDLYGNTIEEKQHGDVSNFDDDRTVVTEYKPESYNTSDWLLSFPASTTIYEGIAGAGEDIKVVGTEMSHTDFYYDGTTSCNTASTNQIPTKGLLTRTVNRLIGGTSPETRLAYDPTGNPECARDANGNESTTVYDSQKTFEISSTNALNHVSTTQYYGVGSVSQDNGLYGQIKQVTDPNNATLTSTYDKLGRVLTVTQPDGFTTTRSYVGFGTVGTQYVLTVNDLGLWSAVYFDGIGRKTTKVSLGTDSKIILTDTEYDVRGAVHRSSLPYYQVGGTQNWTTFSYDLMGRVTRTDNPDGTFALQCYDDWTSTTIDANGHASSQTVNSFGKPATVVEYQEYVPPVGEEIGCASPFVTYSTITYGYDVLGNLETTIDELNNTTTMQYDSLSRKIAMHDPDMGNWTYQYDGVDNLVQQQDAKGQITYMQYDALNRLKQKDYATQKPLGSGDVVNTYDGATSNGIGRLTRVDDSSGSTTLSNTLYYDAKGQLTRSDQVVNSSTYTTQTAYDGLGRTTSITYPDNIVATYNYDGPELKEVKEGSTAYITYSNFNALGQPGTATNGNGVVTTYTYDALSARLDTLKTVSPLAPTVPLMNLDYDFDPVGNINSIDDLNVSPPPGSILRDQSFLYDPLDRLVSAVGPYNTITYSYNEIGNMLLNTRVHPTNNYTYDPAHPHAVKTAGGNTYNYDANGNMTDGAGRTLTYDFENRPTQITQGGVTTDLVYNSDGNRMVKTVGGVSTIYIGKLYVCDNGVCSRMIFAGVQRIAEVGTLSGTVSYYHSDHLGSTAVVTDSTGANVQDLNYHPYGNTFSNVGTVDLDYKFTGKELDGSTGLYFYEARYYDAHLGRFISADTIVPNPVDPQTFNRYAYVLNNPIRYTDPTGHTPFPIITFTMPPPISPGWGVNWGYAPTPFPSYGGGFRGGQGFTGPSSIGGFPDQGLLFNPNRVIGLVGGYFSQASDSIAGFIARNIDDIFTVIDVATVVVVAIEATVVAGPCCGEEVVTIALSASSKEYLKQFAKKHAGKLLKNATKKVIPKSRTGKGSVPPSQRDPKRIWNKKEKSDALDQRRGTCQGCGNNISVDEARGHHIKRHADGGRTDNDNLAILCDPCHKVIHSRK